MGGIRTTIELLDRVTAPARNMVAALNSVVNAHNSVSQAMSGSMNTDSLQRANAAADRAVESINRVSNAINRVNAQSINLDVNQPDIEIPRVNNGEIHISTAVDNIEVNAPEVDMPVNPVISDIDPNISEINIPVNPIVDNIVIPEADSEIHIDGVIDSIQTPQVPTIQTDAEIIDVNLPNPPPVDMEGNVSLNYPESIASITIPADVQWDSDVFEVFTDTGADRFANELNAVNQIMERIGINQQNIANAAANTDILSDTALADIQTVNSRINAIRSRIEILNNTPVDLRTDRVNDEFETLRSLIIDIENSQESLNSAIAGMDAGEINSEYLRLSNTVNRTTQYIRDNTNEQGYFNASIEEGNSLAERLGQTIKGAIAAYIGINGIKLAIEVSDNLVSTEARLGSMNSAFNSINDTATSTDDVINMIYASAQNARGSFNDMADVVARFGNNARDAFSSQEEVIAFTNLIQKQMTVAGAFSEEASNAILQLSQALGSGVLRGDELNSIFEQAPNLIQNIADYLNVPLGSIREMASEGQLTANTVKAAIFSAADSINAQFDTMPKTWNQAWTSMQNTALMAFRPILKRINEIANSEGFQVFVNGAINALSLLASTALTVFDIMTTIAKAIADNWSILAPIILGVTSALLAYAAATRIAAAAQAIYNAILNANPLVRIIMLITIAITLVMAAANAVAKMTKVANTGFGVITGGLNVVKEGFLNLVLAVANVTLGIYNAISALVADIVIAFLNCVTDVEIFFINLQKTVNDVILAIAEALNNLPFIDFDVTGLKQSSINYANEIALKEANKGKFLDIGEEFDKGLNTYDAFADGWMMDAFTAGAEWGDNVWADFENTLAGIGDNPLADIENQYDFGEITNGIADTLDGIAGNIADTAEDTAAMRDVLETSETELKYLREIAEREAINRFTTATINVDMTNNNTINSEQDIDGIIEILQIEVENAMLAVSEGSHV